MRTAWRSRYDLEDAGGGVLDEIEAIVAASLTLGDRNPLGHHVTNTVVASLEGDVASAHSKAIAVMPDGTTGSAVYLDDLVRTGKGWSIRQRTVKLRRRPLTA